MADIIDMTKLREAKTAADATARLHEVLCMAADEAASKILSAEGRAVLASAIVRAALGIGIEWTVSFGSPPSADCAAGHATG